MSALYAVVPGRAHGQGSMRLTRSSNGHEQASYPPATVLHRNLTVSILTSRWNHAPPIAGPVAVGVTVTYPRPRQHTGSGRNTGVLKTSAPTWVTTAPDLDKIMRLVGDALTIAGVILDDAQIAIWRGEKHYTQTPTDQTRTEIEVHELR